jgi:hypothetical protein
VGSIQQGTRLCSLKKRLRRHTLDRKNQHRLYTHRLAPDAPSPSCRWTNTTLSVKLIFSPASPGPNPPRSGMLRYQSAGTWYLVIDYMLYTLKHRARCDSLHRASSPMRVTKIIHRSNERLVCRTYCKRSEVQAMLSRLPSRSSNQPCTCRMCKE